MMHFISSQRRSSAIYKTGRHHTKLGAVFSIESRPGAQPQDRVAADFKSFTEIDKQSRVTMTTIKDLEAMIDTKKIFEEFL
jgi:hypothetical protein